MQKHYNLVREKISCSIVVGEDMYIYADYYTTTQHEAILKRINEQWIMFEDREYTVVADTDGGCDRTEEITYEHSLNMENAIFENDKLVGFYYEFDFYNGFSDKPNAHVFLFENRASLVHYNQKSTWRLQPRNNP